MRAVQRPDAPACFATDTEERAQLHRDRYADQHYPKGAWRSHWNDLDKDDEGVSAVRRKLLAMFDGECAYCGLLVGNDHMQVDHYLPKEKFPLIAYAWENLLPICGACNRRKLQYAPQSLKDKVIIERCLLDASRKYDFVFNKPHLFKAVAHDDRIVDPTFDDPEEHINLVMDIPTYRPKSPVGDITYERLLRHREIVHRLRDIRMAARVVIEVPLSESQFADFARASSHPSLFRRFAEYWRREQEEGAALLP